MAASLAQPAAVANSSAFAASCQQPRKSALAPAASPVPRSRVQSTTAQNLRVSTYFGKPALNAGRPSPNARQTRGAAAAARAQAGTERTYVMVKPDGVQRGLVGEIISKFEKKGFALKGLKLFQTPTELAKEHYKDLSSKPFYGKLVEYIVSGPVVCMVWEGAGVVASARKLIGATNPLAAEPGTIRGDLAVEVGRNVVHGSDSPENAEREIGLWFKDAEVINWAQSMEPWLRE